MRIFHNVMVKTLSLLLEVSMALLVLDVLLGVVSRYVMGSQVPWTEELAGLLLVWSSFFGIALAFNSRAHLGIDLIVNMMGNRRGRIGSRCRITARTQPCISAISRRRCPRISHRRRNGKAGCGMISMF